jgi:hypothetical protein
MIDHTTCDHPRTSGARAKCRRAHRNGDTAPATTKDVDFGRGSSKKASTPRDRDMQCDICGVERIALRGTDPISGLILTVGDKCSYMLKQSADITPLD